MATAVINQHERDQFLKSIHESKFAGIQQTRTIYRSIPITAHRQEFIDNKRGFRDGQRAALFMEAIQIKNASAHVLSFFISLSQAGYKGTICTEEVLSAQVIAATGAKCAPRTFRRALADLCARGWLVKHTMATGTKIPVPGGWKTLQVNKISIPRCTALLGVRRSPKAHNVPPRPKGPATRERKSETLLGSQDLSSVVNYQNKSKVRNEEANSLSTPPTHPGDAPKSSTVKHHNSTLSNTTTKTQPQRAVHPFGRKSRKKIRNTWHNARLLFLHDLLISGASDFMRQTASTQTDLRYPPMLPSAAEWDTILPGWLDLDWKERQRKMKREILPALDAWCKPLTPPDIHDLNPSIDYRRRERAKQQLEQFKRISKIMKSLPEMLINESTPDFVRSIIHEKKWTLSQVPAMLAMGKISLDEITREEFETFDEIAALLNMAD